MEPRRQGCEQRKQTRRLGKAQDVNVVSYNSYTVQRKRETNLVEDRVVIGIGELGLDDGPEPEHRRGISDIRRLCLARPGSKDTTKFTSAGGDHRPGVSALGERCARVVVVVVVVSVSEDCPFDRVPVSLVGEVLARIGEGSSGATNRGESGKTALDDVEAVFALAVLRVWMAHAILGENAP